MCTYMYKFCAQSSGGSSSSSGKGKSTQGRTKVSYGYSLVKGMTNHPMEDYHVADFMRMKGRDLGLFAIFDGHLGHNVPEHLQKNLFDNIFKEVNIPFFFFFGFINQEWYVIVLFRNIFVPPKNLQGAFTSVITAGVRASLNPA